MSLTGLRSSTQSRGDRPESCFHVLRVVCDLGVREPQGRQPGCGVRLIAQPITCLCSRSAVITQPVGLDDQPQVGPEEVDLEVTQGLACQGEAESGRANETQEASL